MKEAARTTTSSGGESSDRRKRQADTPRRRAAARNSSDDDEAYQKKRRDADSDGGGRKEKTNVSTATKRSAKNNKNRTSTGDESGDDQKGRTTSATTDTPRNAASTNLFKKKIQSKLKRMWNAGKMKRTPLLELATIEAVYSAMHGKDKKRARAKLFELFAHYDTEEMGSIDDKRFIKCITKAGVYLRKPADYDALVHCFVKGSSASSEDDDVSADEKKKRSKIVDYVSFIDFACNVRDSEKLSQIAGKLNKIIDKYDGKHNQSTTEPFNIFVDLKKLDKKKRKWIPSDQFATFMAEHERPVFKLSPNEVQALTERFEYEYEKDELGVDYEQFARWLQPMLHLDIKDLHKRVQDLVKKANERSGWDLVEVFQAMDNDADGEVSGTELKEALLEMGLPLTDTQIRCLVDEYDTSGDGRIQCEEFIALFPFLKKNKKDVKGSTTAAKSKTKNESEKEDDTDDARSDRRPNGKKKNTRKNTFSWDIGKAFARKHSVKGNTSAPTSKKKSVAKKKQQATSSEDSSEDSRDNAKGKSAKTKKKVVMSSSDEESDTDQRRKTKRAASRSKKNRRDSSLDTSDSSKKSSSQNQVARRGRDQIAKRGGARRDPSSTETDEDSRVKTKKTTKKGSKPAATTDDSDAKKSSSPATESSAKPRSPRKKKTAESSSTKRRNDRQPSTVSHRSVRRPQARHRSRQRFASASSEKVRRSTRNRSRVGWHSRSSRQPTRRVKADSLDNDGDVTSSAESENGSESSGLDMSQLRQLKKKTICHDGSEEDYHFDEDDDDEEDAEHIRTRSDGEYEKHLKRSLRRAFDFFDLDQSDTIEKKELSHVLRALGHEFTTEELDDEMVRADLDQNGQLDFHEFVAFVKRQLVQKQFLLSKRREMEIRQAFQSLDNDKNGVLDEKEFEYLIYKVLGVELSVEEQDALLDFVDENGDGIINEDEFIAFMRVMEDFHEAQCGKDRQRQFLKGLDRTSRLALTAMKKLVRGAPIDLDRNLLMFFGVPTNFRPAISSFATCRALQANTVEHVLSFPSPQMIVALAQDPSQNGAEKKNTSMFGPTAVSAKTLENVIDENALLQQAESWQSQAIASLKRATGVPKPFDTREEDVVKRCVHVCLFQEQEEMHGKSTTSRASSSKTKKRAQKQPKTGGGAVVGNVHEIPVYWHAGQEDVWEFSKKATKENKYKFLVRTNTVNDHLYLLVEFIVHLRMAKREKTHKGRRRHRKHKPSSSKRDEPASDDDSPDLIGETREMVCCWCKIPIRTLLAKRAGVFRNQLKLWGGTAHAPVDIEHDEILRRRTGWRALTNVFSKPTPPTMGIKSVPIEMFTEDLQLSVRKMPSTIIAPFLSLPILAEYMTLMKTMLSSGNGSSAGKLRTFDLTIDGIIFEAWVNIVVFISRRRV